MLDFQMTITKPNTVKDLPYGFLENRKKGIYPNDICPDFVPDHEPTDAEKKAAKAWRINNLEQSFTLDTRTENDQH